MQKDTSDPRLSHPFTGSGVVEFGFTAVKLSSCSGSSCLIGADNTSVFKGFHKRFNLANCRSHALVPLYITICHGKFYRAHLVQFSSNVLDPHHSWITLFLPNTYFPAVMEDHFEGNCWRHWKNVVKVQHVDLPQTHPQYQPTQRSQNNDLSSMDYPLHTDISCGSLWCLEFPPLVQVYISAC
jgi:hypothetical protein